MAAKKTQEVLINGKIYSLSGYESEEYLQNVASYMNHKYDELRTLNVYRKLPPDMKSLLIELNIADDYFKARDRIDSLESTVTDCQKEIYELKHQLAALEIELEEAKKNTPNNHPNNRHKGH